jgi:hypothetical protein
VSENGPIFGIFKNTWEKDAQTSMIFTGGLEGGFCLLFFLSTARDLKFFRADRLGGKKNLAATFLPNNDMGVNLYFFLHIYAPVQQKSPENWLYEI